MKIVFIGTPEFGAIILEGLIKGGYKPILVVTTTDKPVGRKQILTPSVVKVVAKKHNIQVEQSETIKNLKLKIKNLKPDLGIVAAYGEIIPKNILDIPKFGFLNVHPSLLPKYRGPSPIQFTILNDEKKSGVTIILMDEKMDHGKIISNIKYQIPNNKITYENLLKELAEKGAKLLIETIPKWIKGEIKPKPQDEIKTTYTKILKKEDGKIDWRKSAEEIERQIRAFSPWPGSYVFWQKAGKIFRLKIFKADVLARKKNQSENQPGKTFLTADNKIAVQTGKDYLIIEELQMEGKRKMTPKEFLIGHPDFIGVILG